MTLPQLKQLLSELRDKADVRSRMLIENGREIPETDRARSEGFACAYSFCIQQLESLTEE